MLIKVANGAKEAKTYYIIVIFVKCLQHKPVQVGNGLSLSILLH